MLLKDEQAGKIIISQISIYFLFGFKALSGFGAYRDDKEYVQVFYLESSSKNHPKQKIVRVQKDDLLYQKETK